MFKWMLYKQYATLRTEFTQYIWVPVAGFFNVSMDQNYIILKNLRDVSLLPQFK
jgi:hypothetical protein